MNLMEVLDAGMDHFPSLIQHVGKYPADFPKKIVHANTSVHHQREIQYVTYYFIYSKKFINVHLSLKIFHFWLKVV